MEILIDRKLLRDQIETAYSMIDLILNLGNSSDQNINGLKGREARLQAIRFHLVLS